MIEVEHRKMFRSNGLLDDFVLYGRPSDYVALASSVRSVIDSGKPEIFQTSSHITIRIEVEEDLQELFTSLQNSDNFYASMDDWERRDILTVAGGNEVLEALDGFLQELSARGEGYSYLSEYSEQFAYAAESPRWRLHVLSL
ncbi:MAG TPA: hypothetical protein VGE64_03105 [Xanthomonadaceae bacterium]